MCRLIRCFISCLTLCTTMMMPLSVAAQSQAGRPGHAVVGHDQFDYGERRANAAATTRLARVGIYLSEPMEVHIAAHTSATSLASGATNFTLGLSSSGVPNDLTSLVWSASGRFVTIPSARVWVNCGSRFVTTLPAGNHSLVWFAGNVKGGEVIFDAGSMSVQAFPLSQRSPGMLSKKLALLIGINDYQNVTDLAGCVHDVEDVKRLLTNRFDFDNNGIEVLTDSQATRQNILDALERLVENADRETAVVIHYSGHGSQTTDDSGDESDGLDETIVPHDRGPSVRDISDDTLNGFLRRLAAKTNYLTFVFDSCHSGTVTRTRGAVARWVAPQDPRTLQRVTQRRNRGELPELDLEAGATSMNDRDDSYVVISGCRPDELSYEMVVQGRRRGALTYHFTNVIRESSQAGLTYRDVMGRAADRVTAHFRGQHPQIEGANQDDLVFDVPALSAPKFYRVELSGGQLTIASGAIDGLTVDSRLDLFPVDSTNLDPARRIAEIRLTGVGPNSALAELVGNSVVPAVTWGILRQRGVDPNAVLVFVNRDGVALDAQDIGALAASDASTRLAVAAPQELEALSDRIRSNPAFSESLKLTEDPGEADLFVFRRTDDKYEISDGSETLFTVAASDALATELGNKLVAWARWQRLVELENPDSELRAEIEVIPLDDRPRDDSSMLTFTEGEELRLMVTNTSEQPLYYSILLASTDGQISLLYPPRNPLEQTPLPPGEQFITPSSTTNFGTTKLDELVDHIKLIASVQPIDLRPIEQAQLRAIRSSSPLVELLVPGQIKTRGTVPVFDWTTAMTKYRLVRKTPLDSAGNQEPGEAEGQTTSPP